MFEWLGGNLGALVLGLGTGAALLVAGKFIPKFLGKQVADKLSKAMMDINAIADPKRKEFAQELASVLVRWTEYEIPDKGQGQARFAAVADKLIKFIPALKGKKVQLAGIIENAVAAMDAELKKEAAKPKV